MAMFGNGGLRLFLILLIGSAILPESNAVLELAGFSAGGVVKGSIAATVQSGIGNVAAGSTFAALQSLGTYAAFSNPVTAGVAVAGGIYYLFR